MREEDAPGYRDVILRLEKHTLVIILSCVSMMGIVGSPKRCIKHRVIARGHDLYVDLYAW